MDKRFIRLKQGELTMLLTSLTAEELVQNTAVESYNSATKEGYQRPLTPSHYRKIAKYLKDSNDPILAPAILTAIDSNKVSIVKDIMSTETKLRVVDGQHRIQGIKYCFENDIQTFNKIMHYDFPVIILLVETKEDRIWEITTFVDINSKGKKVPTDLAIELREKLRRQNWEIALSDQKELIESISFNICEEMDKTDVWFNLIKRGDEPGRVKPISLSAFTSSLKPIVEAYQKNVKTSPEATIDILVEYVRRSWTLVSKKWSQCFDDKQGKYNIQKGIGVFPIHMIMGEVLDSSEGDIEKALIAFRNILNASKATPIDWKQGGKFSPFNSQTGFALIAKYIKNEKTFLTTD